MESVDHGVQEVLIIVQMLRPHIKPTSFLDCGRTHQGNEETGTISRNIVIPANKENPSLLLREPLEQDWRFPGKEQ